METKIIDGRRIRNEILEGVKRGVAELSFQPVFCDVLVGNDSVSRQYVEMKAKTAERMGMRFHNAHFEEDISPEDLIREIKDLGKIEGISGVIVQLPLPSKFNDFKREILDSVPSELDVDCLGSKASESFYRNENEIGFPTALACITILDSLFENGLGAKDTKDEKGENSKGEVLANEKKSFNKEELLKEILKDKKIVVLGQGELVGKPVTALLRFRGLEPITIRSSTENKEQLIKEADVIISGVGKGKYIRGDMIKEGAILIDAGTSESNGGIVGDIDMESVNGIAGYLSPVPGGVGPVTVATLLENVLKVARKLEKS